MVGFNLVTLLKSTKPPNLIPCQNFPLYGMCIRGACSQMHSPVFAAPVNVQIAEAHF